MSDASLKYRRVVLKVSGEAFCEPGGFGLERGPLERTATEITQAAAAGAQIAVVCGGGNLIRGAAFRDALGLTAAGADYIGMLGTVMNAIALAETLERLGQPARVLSAMPIDRIGELFTRSGALAHLAAGRVIVLAAGTGNPHVTTDTCAALRAAELDADLVMKATKVDGVYDSDPKTNPDAKRFDTMSYDQVIDGRLKVMDISATDVCQQHNVPVIVFNLFLPGVITDNVMGRRCGTLIHGG